MAATKFVNGHPIYEEIGELKIQEVLAEDLSECKVSKNGDTVLKYMKDYLLSKTSDSDAAVLCVESKCNKSFDEKFGDFEKGAKRVKEGLEIVGGIKNLLFKKKK